MMTQIEALKELKRLYLPRVNEAFEEYGTPVIDDEYSEAWVPVGILEGEVPEVFDLCVSVYPGGDSACGRAINLFVNRDEDSLRYGFEIEIGKWRYSEGVFNDSLPKDPAYVYGAVKRQIAKIGNGIQF